MPPLERDATSHVIGDAPHPLSQADPVRTRFPALTPSAPAGPRSPLPLAGEGWEG